MKKIFFVLVLALSIGSRSSYADTYPYWLMILGGGAVAGSGFAFEDDNYRNAMLITGCSLAFGGLIGVILGVATDEPFISSADQNNGPRIASYSPDKKECAVSGIGGFSISGFQKQKITYASVYEHLRINIGPENVFVGVVFNF